jgi:hypothetical protein
MDGIIVMMMAMMMMIFGGLVFWVEVGFWVWGLWGLG